MFIRKISRQCVWYRISYTPTLLSTNVAYNAVTITTVHYMTRHTNSNVRNIPNVRTRVFKTPKLPNITLYRLEGSVSSKRRMFLCVCVCGVCVVCVCVVCVYVWCGVCVCGVCCVCVCVVCV